MTGLILIRRGSEYVVEAPPSTSAVTGTSETEEKYRIDEEIGRINDIIADLQGKIRALQRHRNGLSSLSRLPDDLLVEIWKHVAYSRPQSKDWLQITHVCSRWRQVALDSPTLWQEPLFGTEEMTEEMIRRSRNASLSFEMTPQSSYRPGAHQYYQRLFRTFQDQMHRIESLSLDLNRLPSGIFLEFKSAPILTKLSLSYSSLAGDGACFFEGSCPNLTHISLIECDLFECAESIQTLPRVIDLTIDILYESTRASHQQAISSLKRFPNLRKLLLRNVFKRSEATAEVDIQTNFGTLYFPELETLRIDGESVVLPLRFLDLIRYPTSTSVLIEMELWQMSKDSWPILSSLIDRFDSGPKSLVVDSKSRPDIFSLRFGPSEDASKPKGGSVTLQAKSMYLWLPLMRDFLLRLLTLPVLHDLRSINHFAPDNYYYGGFWTSCGNLPLLETLRLECDQPEFLKILALPSSTKDGANIRPYFPSLRTLVLQDDPGHHESARYSTGLDISLTAAFAEECRRIAKVRKEEFHEQFEYEVLVV